MLFVTSVEYFNILIVVCSHYNSGLIQLEEPQDISLLCNFFPLECGEMHEEHCIYRPSLYKCKNH